MSIYQCKICNTEFDSPYKYSKHITHTHKIKTEKYYEQYVKLESEGKCLICESQTGFESVCKGYNKICKSKKCCAAYSKDKLRNDPEKFEKFKSKVKINQSRIWKEREESGEAAIMFAAIGKKLSKNNINLTIQERKEKYSRYYMCSEEKIDELNRKGAIQLLKLNKEHKTGYIKMTKGRFRPINPKKYKGDPTNIIYRSSYELKFMMMIDKNKDIISWNSEEVVIPYFDKTTNRHRRYFVDFWIKSKDKNGKISESLIEIKPQYETVEPKPKAKGQHTKSYIRSVETWLVNQAKWDAAKMFCEERDMEFIILTERELFTTK